MGHFQFRLTLVATLAAASSCTGAGDRAPALSSTHIVEDVQGRSVSTDSPALRIVALLPAATSTLLDLGLRDRIVARTDYDTDPQLASLPSVGGGFSPDAERIAAVRPDLVVLFPSPSDRTTAPALDRMKVRWFGVRPEKLADVRQMTRSLGQLTRREHAADSLIAQFDSVLRAVHQHAIGRRPLTVVYLLGGHPPMIVGTASYLQELIANAGGRAAFPEFTGQNATISVESVVQRNPDVILIPVGEAGFSASIAALAKEPGWSGLAAVKAGHVHEISADLFHRPDLQLARAARILDSLFARDAQR